MSLASFVAASLDELHAGRYDVALALACAAVDATAARHASVSAPSGNAKRFKGFLEDNMRVITTFGFPGIIADGIRIKCTNVPDLKTDPNGYVSVSDIIYHAVRCGLLHECVIDERIEFTKETSVGDFDRKFEIPRNVIFGLLMAVILSPLNRAEVLDREYSVSIHGTRVDLQSLWGQGANVIDAWRQDGSRLNDEYANPRISATQPSGRFR